MYSWVDDWLYCETRSGCYEEICYQWQGAPELKVTSTTPGEPERQRLLSTKLTGGLAEMI